MINVNIKGLKKAKKKLSSIPKGVERAANRAINRTATSAKAMVAKTVSKEYFVKSGDVKKTIDCVGFQNRLLDVF